jgi:Fe-S-cluster containining protein
MCRDSSCQAASSLVAIRERIDRRVSDMIEEAGGDWLCRRGCDGCCRSLAALPSATAEEWAQIDTFLSQMSPSEQSEIVERANEALQRTGAPGHTCPFLHLQAGTCRIYPVRPIACRTYGFFRERDKALVCQTLLREVEGAGYDQIVWGNAESIDADVSRVGPQIGFAAWWQGRSNV